MFKKGISHIGIYLILLNIIYSVLFLDLVNSSNHLDNEKIENLSTNVIEKKDYANDRLIIKFKENTGNKPSFTTIQSKLPTKALEKLEYLSKVNIGILSFNDKLENIDLMIRDLSKIPDIEYVEKDYRMDIDYTGIESNDSQSIEQWYLKSIQADDAWKIYDDTENKTTVSVNDTGLDYNHPDLALNLKDLSSVCYSETGALIEGGCLNHGLNFEKQNVNETVFSKNETFDTNGHGTHVAGIIGAVGNNGTGVIGVSQNTQIMSARLDTYRLYDYYFYFSNVIEGLNFAVENGAKVVNASYGSTFYSSGIYDSIVTAKNNGTLLIAAAGNSNSNNDGAVSNYPSSYNLDNIISVASVGEDDTLAGYSNYGLTSVDLAAPGGDLTKDSGILSTYILEETAFEDDLSTMSGTTWYGTGADWYLYGSGLGFHTQTPILYTGGLDYSLKINNLFSLSGATAAKLRGYMNCDFGTFAYDADFGDGLELHILDSEKDETTLLDTFYYDYSGDFEIPLRNNEYLKDNLQIYFRFVTDNDDDVGGGCRIDDLSVVKYSKNKHSYKSLQGTSMATPVVTGVASMIWSYKPDLTYLEVKDIILSSVDVLGELATKVVTSGKVNAKNAIKELIFRYGITKSGTFEGENFDTPFINLDGKAITLVDENSSITLSSTGNVLNLSGSTINGTGTIIMGTGTSLYNGGVNFLNTSADFDILIKTSTGDKINNGSTIYGESLMLSYSGSHIGQKIKLYTSDYIVSGTGMLYDGELTQNQIVNINSSFTGDLISYVYKDGDIDNGISSSVVLNSLNKVVLNNIDFQYTPYIPSLFTGTLNFSSGSSINSTGAYIELFSSQYPVDYEITGDVVGTYTGTLNNSGTILVELSPGDGIKNLSGVFKNLSNQLSQIFTGSIMYNPLTVFDTVPNNFSFSDIINSELSTDNVSNTITITGINTGSIVSISNGLYSINSGDYTSSEGLINNSDTIKIKLKSSPSYLTKVDSILTIGGISDVFSVTTKSIPVSSTGGGSSSGGSSSGGSSSGGSSSGGSSSGGSSSGGSSSGGFAKSYQICTDAQLECKAVKGSTTLFKLYKKNGFTCVNGNLGKECNNIINPQSGSIDFISGLSIEKLEDSVILKNSILEKLYTTKKQDLIKKVDKIAEIAYLGEDINLYKTKYINTYAKWVESLSRLDYLIGERNIEGAKKEVKNSSIIYKSLNNYFDDLDIRSIKIEGKDFKYLKYNDKKIQKIQIILFNKMAKKRANIEIYTLANKVVHNLNKLLTDKTLSSDQIKLIREETISIYKKYIKEYRELSNK